VPYRLKEGRCYVAVVSGRKGLGGEILLLFHMSTCETFFSYFFSRSLGEGARSDSFWIGAGVNGPRADN
jgi:hypothetical protein